MIPPADAMAEFFHAYDADFVTPKNRTEVETLCSLLILEERTEFYDAREKLKTLDDGSDAWFKELAHCMKELCDMKYVTWYAAFAHHLDIKPVYQPSYRQTLTGQSTFAVINDLNMLMTLPPEHTEVARERLRLLKENLCTLLSDIEQTMYDFGASPDTAPELFALVHKSNMDKRWPDGKIRKDRVTKKVKKPKGFVGPEAEIEAILRRTLTETSKIG